MDMISQFVNAFFGCDIKLMKLDICWAQFIVKFCTDVWASFLISCCNKRMHDNLTLELVLGILWNNWQLKTIVISEAKKLGIKFHLVKLIILLYKINCWRDLESGFVQFKMMNFKMMNMQMTIFSSSIWIICFRHLLGPISVSAINTAEGK